MDTNRHEYSLTKVRLFLRKDGAVAEFIRVNSCPFVVKNTVYSVGSSNL
jgi:hypothetical protein